MKINRYNLLVLVLILFNSFVFLNNANAQYKRNIIFEEFSEVWCGPCAALAPILAVWLENHPDYNAITYYSYFMVNGKRMNSPSEYQFRKSFYSVPFYPFAVINSVKAPNTAYPGYPTDTSKINFIIDTMATISPVKIDMDFTNNGKTGNVSLTITSSEKLENKNLYKV